MSTSLRSGDVLDVLSSTPPGVASRPPRVHGLLTRLVTILREKGGLVDSHCHLDDPQFDADREAVIQRAREAGVEQILAIGSGPPDLEAAIRLAEAWPHIFATVGVHPHEASKATEGTFERMGELLAHPKVVAIGEIGLDYHYDFSPREVQREVFSRQLTMARKPVVIHTREAWEDTLRLLREHPGATGVFHCFSGGPEEAEQVLAMGFYISFAGVVTFPKALRIQEAARRVPSDRLLVETDAPYLAPVPKRGKRNEPAFVVETARRLAELRGEPLDQLAAATTENFRRIFAIGETQAPCYNEVAMTVEKKDQ